MPAFGAKTIAALVKEVTEDASVTVLDAAANASVRMKPVVALQELAEPLKAHPNIKRLILSDCEINDPACEVLAEILAANHVIEELVLDKNKISSEGAGKLAAGLKLNQGLRTLSLLQQKASTGFGDETVERFANMFNDNITLTKISWSLESQRAFLLPKFTTRNIEIQKRKACGQDYTTFLPDHLRAGAPPAADLPREEPAEAAYEEAAPVEEAPVEEEPAVQAEAEAEGAPVDEPAVAGDDAPEEDAPAEATDE